MQSDERCGKCGHAKTVHRGAVFACNTCKTCLRFTPTPKAPEVERCGWKDDGGVLCDNRHGNHLPCMKHTRESYSPLCDERECHDRVNVAPPAEQGNALDATMRRASAEFRERPDYLKRARFDTASVHRTVQPTNENAPERPAEPQEMTPCALCSKGFPLGADGWHYGSQRMGMIESTPCSRSGEPMSEQELWIVTWRSDDGELINEGHEECDTYEQAERYIDSIKDRWTGYSLYRGELIREGR